MFYFKPLIRKLITEQEDVKNIEKTGNDRDAISHLLNCGINRDEIVSVFEKHYGVSHVDIRKHSIQYSDVKGFDLNALIKIPAIPYDLDKESRTHHFAISDIMNESLKSELQAKCKSLGTNANFYFAFDFEIVEKIKEIESTLISPKSNISEDDFDAEDWVNRVIATAIKKSASDIHIESLKDGVQVRYRIDGILSNKKTYVYESSVVSTIIARIKIISEMDISEKRKPQDGRLDDFIYNNNHYDLRVSSVKTIYGEKIVMRIFNKTGKILTFNEIGFSSGNANKIKKILSNPNGIIYMAGATGSGKTTTLYTMIDHINSDDINMYTIEDPVEKTIKNVNQIQIDLLAGIDYPNTLRALLRQDPDVIVVGEIRDIETADLAMRASLTGHLVLSTIHANSAIDSISRLMDMGIEPYLLGASSIAFLSQRLVRTLCPHCKAKTSNISNEEMSWIEYQEKEYGIKLNIESDIYGPNGCPHCNDGFKGRVAIIELLDVTDTMKHLIKEEKGSKEIRETAMKEGFEPLIVNAFNLIESGETSISEVMKQL